MPYQTPSWFTKAIVTRDLTPAFIKKAESDATMITNQNKVQHQQLVKLHNEIVAQAEAIYGRGTAPVKYLKAHKPESPPNIQSVLERLKKRARVQERRAAETVAKEQANEKRRERNRLHQRRYSQTIREFKDACLLEGTTFAEIEQEYGVN